MKPKNILIYVAVAVCVVMLFAAPATSIGADSAAPRSVTEWIAMGRPDLPVQPAAVPAVTAQPQSLSYYSSRVDFDASYPGLPVEGYENGSMPNGSIIGIPHPLDASSSNAYFDPGDILPGIQFWANNNHSGDEIAVLGEQVAGSPSKTAVANYYVDSYRIVFDPPVGAAGMDLQVYAKSGSCQVDIYDTSGFLASTVSPCSAAGVFWGVASDAAPLAELVITELGGGAEGVDNIAFGPVCESDNECDDGLFCTGVETCDNGTCVASGDPCHAETPVCDEDSAACVECLTDGNCTEGQFCDEGTCRFPCELFVTYKEIRAEKLTKPRKVVLNVTSADESFDIFGLIDLSPLTWENVKFNGKKNRLRILAIVPAGLEPGSLSDQRGRVLRRGSYYRH